MDNPLYWTLWFLTLLLCGWVMVDGIRKPHRLLEWPFLIATMWMYFYVYMSYDAMTQFPGAITPKAFVLGQLFPLLSLAGLLIGWHKAAPKSNRAAAPYAKIENRFIIWCIGMALIIVGAAGGYLVQAEREAAGNFFDYKSTTAYYYLLFYVGYPGMALAFWVAARWAGESKILLWAASLVALCIFLYPHVSFLRRGPTFPAIILLLFVPPIARRRAPNRAFYVTGLAALGVVMLAYLPLRRVMYNKGTWSEAFSEFSLTEAVTERGKKISDNEFVNNCHMIEALASNGKYQFGTGHISLFFHWIPRGIWKDKPALGEGSYTHVELFDDVEESAGMKLLGGGSAAGGVADSFVQYGWLTPLFFMGLGWLVSKAYWKGRHKGKILWIHGYIAVVCATHWLISQGLSAAFVPLLAFLIIPVLLLRFVGSIRIRGIRRTSKKIRSRTAGKITAPAETPAAATIEATIPR